MAMGTRKKRERQEELWVVTSEVVNAPAHAFYDRLNQLFELHHFDRSVEHLCRRYYRDTLGSCLRAAPLAWRRMRRRSDAGDAAEIAGFD